MLPAWSAVMHQERRALDPVVVRFHEQRVDVAGSMATLGRRVRGHGAAAGGDRGLRDHGDRLADGTVALALLANTLATGAALVALILAFGPISGAHFNPAVSVAAASLGLLSAGDVMAYVPAQVLGAFLGTACANTMFASWSCAWRRTLARAFLKR